MKKLFLFAILSLFFWTHDPVDVQARVRLPQHIASGMVLQRGQPLTLHGWGDAGEKIVLAFRGKKYRATTDAQGLWQITLPAQKPGGPYTMRVNDTTLTDVWVGDVILCAGQSNMELPVSRVVDLFAEEVSNYENAAIRQLRIPITYTFEGPQDDLPTCRWVALTPESAMHFSALGYFLARQLYERTSVPVGIINNAVGGSTVESWLDKASLQDYPSMRNTLYLNRDEAYVQSVVKSERLRRRLWVEALNREDPGCGRWSACESDDSDWTRRSPFDSSWARDADGRVLNGSTWWRHHFDASSIDTAQAALLRLGCLVDADSVFVNGRFVGTTSYQYPPRKYTVPAGLLRRNVDNVVSVRLLSYSGTPAFVPDKPYRIEQGEKAIPLDGEWLFRRGAVMPPLPGETFFMWQPTALYNSMMAPLASYGVRAVVWYQGESNTGDTRRYAELLPLLIGRWRTLLGNDGLPFIVVQLPEFMAERSYPTESGWAAMREVQRRIFLDLPDVGLAVTLGTGEWNDIHPLDKKTVADRVARQLFRLAYGENVTTAPMVEGACCQGDTIVLQFDNGGSPLFYEDSLRGFSVQGKDGCHAWARVLAVGDDTVTLLSPVDNPRRVRYAWADNPGKPLLRNKEGLPASPFEIEIDSETPTP